MTTSFPSTPPHLVVLGDTILDHYVYGSAARLNPEAPVPVVDVATEDYRLGGAANVANNLVALGATVSLLSVVGDDQAGERLRSALQTAGIDSRAVIPIPGRRTTVKNRIVVESQQVARVDWETREPIPRDIELWLSDEVSRQIQSANGVLISDYGKGAVTPKLAQHVIQESRARGIPVLVDPKDDIQKYRGATLLKPNQLEVARLTGRTLSGDHELFEAGRSIRESLELEHVMITLGDKGFALIDDNLLAHAATAKEVVDVTGAGDTTLAALAWGLASGKPIGEAAKMANRAAGIAVGKFGAACVTPEELQEFEPSPPVPANIRTVAELARMTSGLQAEGKRVVFTNGCFDLLHVGHIAYLKESRRCGDLLIVGINSDASVKRLKGESRPMFSQDERSQIVAALSAVDYVFIFDEDTPYAAIQAIQPDVLTKGDDYAYEDVVGNDLVDDVRLIPLVRGKSSTNSIARVREGHGHIASVKANIDHCDGVC